MTNEVALSPAAVRKAIILGRLEEESNHLDTLTERIVRKSRELRETMKSVADTMAEIEALKTDLEGLEA